MLLKLHRVPSAWRHGFDAFYIAAPEFSSVNRIQISHFPVSRIQDGFSLSPPSLPSFLCHYKQWVSVPLSQNTGNGAQGECLCLYNASIISQTVVPLGSPRKLCINSDSRIRTSQGGAQGTRLSGCHHPDGCSHATDLSAVGGRCIVTLPVN